MKETLLEVLCEPGTRSALELRNAETREGEIWTGTLRSTSSGKEYAIRDGIPRFVPGDEYTDSFGFQWNRFSQVQLDSANGAPYSRRRFDAEISFTAAEARGKWMLDGGCGCGRFAEIAAETGANVIAFDYSSAVDAARRNLTGKPNVHFVQGDLLNPPIKPGALQFAYSIGVLQHTPDPRKAFSSILEMLEPGGKFGFTIYGRRWYTYCYSKYWLRPITRKIDGPKLLSMIESAMPFWFGVTDVLFRIPGLGKVFQFLIPVANYVDKTEFTREQRYQEAILDTFDMLSPSFDEPMSPEEAEVILNQFKVTDLQFRARIPVNVTGSIPRAAR